jgi:hypothetical protein
MYIFLIISNHKLYQKSRILCLLSYQDPSVYILFFDRQSYCVAFALTLRVYFCCTQHVLEISFVNVIIEYVKCINIIYKSRLFTNDTLFPGFY